MGASESKSKERSNFLIKAEMGNPHFLTKGIVSSDFRVKAIKSLIQSDLVIKKKSLYIHIQIELYSLYLLSRAE